MENLGWFKFYRIYFEDSMWKHPTEFRLFIWLLGHAVHDQKGVDYGIVKIKRGQYLRSYRKLQDDLEYIENNQVKKYSTSTIKKWTESLEKKGKITASETELGTLFTIVNYDQYRELQIKNESFHDTESGGNNEQRTPPEHSSNNNKNEKKVYSQTSDEIRLSKLLYNLIVKRNPKHSQPNLDLWAIHIDRMILLDKRAVEEIEEVIQWTQSDSFWQNNILSTKKLREKFDQLFLKMSAEQKSKILELNTYE